MSLLRGERRQVRGVNVESPRLTLGATLPRGENSADRSVPSRLGYDLSTLHNVTEPRAQQVVSAGAIRPSADRSVPSRLGYDLSNCTL